MRRMTWALLLIGASAFASSPTITSVNPASLGTTGGLITVTGTDFAPDAVVKIGAYDCDSLTVVSSTQFTCTAPENIASKQDISLLNGDGGGATLSGGLAYAGTPGFALLQDRVFTRIAVNNQGLTVVYKCSKCHGGAKPEAGLDTAIYSQVAARTVSGDPADSTLYKELSSGKMPPAPKYPPLAVEELRAVSDWIRAGAQNN